MITAVVKILAPSGSLERSVKTAVSVFLICAIIIPVFKNKSEIFNYSSSDTDESSETEQALYDEVRIQTENYLRTSIEDILKKHGIAFGEVAVQMKIQNGSVSVDSVTVFNADKDAEIVKKVIRNELGVEVTVINK